MGVGVWAGVCKGCAVIDKNALQVSAYNCLRSFQRGGWGWGGGRLSILEVGCRQGNCPEGGGGGSKGERGGVAGTEPKLWSLPATKN